MAVSRVCIGVETRGRRVSDDVAFDAFCEREWPRLVAALGYQCGDVAVAEELAQETLVRVYQRWGRVSQLSSPGGWAHRVAMNLGTSWLRRRQAERRARARLGIAVDAYVDRDATDGVAVRAALAKLPPDQRAVVILKFYLGFRAVDVADCLGVSSEAVRTRTHRALRSLAADVDEAAEELVPAPEAERPANEDGDE